MEKSITLTDCTQKKRIEWIDIAKGIGMVLVMLGHAQIPYVSPFCDEISIQDVFLYSFHIPLFMFLSGLCFSDKDIKFSEFFKKKFKSLIVPYIFFAIVSVAAQCVIDFVTNHSLSIHTLLNEVKAVTIQIRAHTIWFLACLVFLELAFYFIKKICNNHHFKIAIFTLIFLICGIVYRKFVAINLPWNIDLVPMLMPFFAAGYCVKSVINSPLTKKHSLLFVLAVIINQGVNLINLKFFSPHFIDVYSNAYGNYILFFISAFSGIYAMVLFCKYFDGKMKIFQYIGRNSLIFLGLHRFVFFIARMLLDKLNLSDIVTTVGWLFAIVITLAVLSLLNEIIIRTPFKFVLGK